MLIILMEEFSDSLRKADHIILTPVYAAGEKEIQGANHLSFADKIKAKTLQSVTTVEQESDLAPLIKQLAQKKSYVICMGAGDISQWAYRLPKALQSLKN
jgi:UDP-N-acetylmuramate--alanine ligase